VPNNLAANVFAINGPALQRFGAIGLPIGLSVAAARQR
jgi:hypothetical protein